MPLLLLGVLIGVILVLFYRAYSSSSGVRIYSGETYIVIDDGTLRLRRGWIAPETINALADILRNAGITEGYITVTNDKRVMMSWHIPPALHQPIRNVLLLRSARTPRTASHPPARQEGVGAPTRRIARIGKGRPPDE